MEASTQLHALATSRREKALRLTLERILFERLSLQGIEP